MLHLFKVELLSWQKHCYFMDTIIVLGWGCHSISKTLLSRELVQYLIELETYLFSRFFEIFAIDYRLNHFGPSSTHGHFFLSTTSNISIILFFHIFLNSATLNADSMLLVCLRLVRYILKIENKIVAAFTTHIAG